MSFPDKTTPSVSTLGSRIEFAPSSRLAFRVRSILGLGWSTLLLSLFVAGSTHAATIPVPAGLNPGDKYHIVFVSSTTGNATSTSIATYNAFVQAAADAAFGVGHGVTWSAIGSTATIDGRDNALVSAPVYDMAGNLVASGYADFWDGSLSSAPNYDENAVLSNTTVFTGTAFAGASTSAPLGGVGGKAATGLSSSTIGGWTDTGVDLLLGTNLSFYGLSEELTVVPEPGTAMMLMLGLFGLAAARPQN